jgi:outer membrane receptor protein involved in Fe transport
LRIAYNKTVARPSFREKSTVEMINKVGDVIIGNPLLKETIIDNIDFRFEKYFNPGELFSFGGFFKKFKNPIEKTFNTKAQNPEITWRNVDYASLYGAETEFSKKLDFISKLKNITYRANLTYIYSQVSIDEQELESKRYYDPNYSDKREMFEQSPWIFNTTLSYDNDSIGLSANVSFTYNAKKLAIINPNGIPDIYQKSSNDLIFNISKTLKKSFVITFEVKNILNDRETNIYEYNGKEYFFDDYGWGREFNLILSYKF